MNEQNTIHQLDKTKSLQNNILDEVRRKFFEVVGNAEVTSKDKYITKLKLIESADDISFQEKLDAMDKNYNCRKQEHYQNLFYLAIISFSVVGISVVIKNAS